MTSDSSSSVTYSVVVPIYRDHYLVQDFCDQFQNVLPKFKQVQDVARDIELIFVTDGGGRDDENEVRRVCDLFPFVKGVLLSRNFGQHLALTAGYRLARGSMVGMLNVDQQDPISELPKFYEHLSRQGADIVYG
jgi:dolichol-phosphate mannosyltransferase